MPARAPEPLRLLLEAAVRLGRPTVSWRLSLARARAHVIEEVVPEDVRGRVLEELRAAADGVPAPLSAREVRAAIREAWDEEPGDVLDALDDEPVAVTPTAQVHRGVLDGAPVAVKVLRPRLAEQLRNDLALGDALVRPARAAFPALDAAAVLREVRERVQEDVDLEHEATAQRAFARVLRSDPRFTAPAPVTRLAGHRVLVAEWVDGAQPGEADSAALLVLWVGAARSAGMLHCDPELEHVRRLSDGRLALLDFGATRRVDPARVGHAERALGALQAGDEAAFAAALSALGAIEDAGDARAALALAREIAGPFLDGPARLDTAALIAVRDRALARADELWELARRARLPAEDLWPLRMAGQLVVVLARLGATADWIALARAALRDGWAAEAEAGAGAATA